MTAQAITTVHLIRRGRTAASARDAYLRSGQGARETIEKLREELTAVASGALSGKLVVRVDGSEGAAASQTITMDQSDSTAGDQIIISVPGYPPYVLTAVSGSAIAADGEYSTDTGDNAVAASVAAAITAMPGLSAHVSAEASSAVVTVTATAAGSGGNSIALSKAVTTGTAVALGGSTLSGGADPGARPTVACTFGSANIANDDTISVGAVTFTWVAAPDEEGELETSTTEATAASRFAAGVNGHSKLEGLVSAEADGAVVTLTWLGDPRTAQLVTLSRAETNSGAMTWAAAAFTPLTTESYGGSAPSVFALGAP